MKEAGNKFEITVELIKMSVRVEDTAIFKVQMRCPGAFKVVSKKYRVTKPSDIPSEKSTFSAFVDF